MSGECDGACKDVQCWGDKVRWCKFEGPTMQVTEMLLMIGCECV